MTERRLVVETERVAYEGIFNVKELYSTVESLLKDKGYFVTEKNVQETVLKSGKNIERELVAEKKLSDYAKSRIGVRIKLSNVKEVKLKKDNKTRLMNQGNTVVVVGAFLETDYEKKWSSTERYFLRTIFEKFLYGSEVSKFEGVIKQDVSHLKDNIKAFLNLYK